MEYYIYILESENNKFYTGITTDYKRRFEEHLNKKSGAKWTKYNKPKKLVLLYKTNNRSNASKLEYRIKSLTREKKQDLIKSNKNFKKYFESYIDTSLYKRQRV